MMLARSAPKPARLTRQGWPAALFFRPIGPEPGTEPFTFSLIPTLEGTLDSAQPLGATNLTELAVTGSTEQGQRFTVTALGATTFAGAMPERLVYTDYSNAIIGTEPGTSAQIGSWDTGGGVNGQTRFVTGGINGRPALPIYDHTQDPEDNNNPVNRRGLLHAPGYIESFSSMALRVPPGKAWFGATNHPDWIALGGVQPRTFITDSALKATWHGVDEEDDLADYIVHTYGSKRISHGGNNKDVTQPPLYIYLEQTFDWDGWTVFEGGFVGDAATPTNGLHFNRVVSRVAHQSVRGNGRVVKDGSGVTAFNSVNYCRWANGNTLCQVLGGYDYQAVGAYAACRAVIGDHPVFARCRRIAPCPPNSWAATAVEATANNPEIPSGKPKFVFLMNRQDLPITATGALANPEVLNG